MEPPPLDAALLGLFRDAAVALEIKLEALNFGDLLVFVIGHGNKTQS